MEAARLNRGCILLLARLSFCIGARDSFRRATRNVDAFLGVVGGGLPTAIFGVINEYFAGLALGLDFIGLILGFVFGTAKSNWREGASARLLCVLEVF